MSSAPGPGDSDCTPSGHLSSPGERKTRRGFLALLTVLVSLLVAVVAGEVALRAFFARRLALVQDERNLLYRYDPVLGWFPVASSSNQFMGTRRITVVNNHQGFRAAADYGPDNRRRIVFLGDSFVWGYDVQVAERFTEKLEAKHPEWKIYNFGVSGYGTDQEYLLLQQLFDVYKPQVVFLMYGDETDEADNATNQRWGYYKPYCTLSGSRLQLRGIPVPRSERFFFAKHKLISRSYLGRLVVLGYFALTSPRVVQNQPNPTGALIRDMQKYVQSKGALFVAGLTWHNPPLEEFLTYFKIPFVDLTTELRYQGMGDHWSAEGHTFVANKIDAFLVRGNYLGSGAVQAPSRP